MTAPHYADDMVTLYVGDCRKVLPGVLADSSVDAVVTDPPYELGFMGRGWDASGVAFDPATWQECLRVAKPGAHLLAFGGTRTWHRVAVAIEDAGWEFRDTLMWIYGSGFPKSLDVSKAIDKAAGADREPDEYTGPNHRNQVFGRGITLRRGEPTTEAAARWDGWGTALKPGWEPIILARKPLAGTVAQNVQAYGTGALNIAACRVEPTGESRPRVAEASQETRYTERGGTNFAPLPGVRGGAPEGRWPTNLVFSHSAGCVEDGPCQADCPVAELDRQSGVRPGSHSQRDLNAYTDRNKVYSKGVGNVPTGERAGFNDIGGASRFFPVFRYEAKASSAERPKLDDGTAHATVKPLDLIRWLTRLITPPGGLVLDPFGGSGTTAEAATIEGFRSVLIELEPPHAELIKQRLSKPIQPTLFGQATP